jgi:hypothetical protein
MEPSTPRRRASLAELCALVDHHKFRFFIAADRRLDISIFQFARATQAPSHLRFCGVTNCEGFQEESGVGGFLCEKNAREREKELTCRLH